TTLLTIQAATGCKRNAAGKLASVGANGIRRISAVKISIGSLNAVEIIQRSGNSIAAQIATIARCIAAGVTVAAADRGREPLRQGSLPISVIHPCLSSVMDVPFDDAELEPGDRHHRDHDHHRDRARFSDLEEPETALIQVVEQVGGLTKRPAI